MDIIIFLILIIIVLILFRDSRVIIFFIGTSDVVLRLIHFIKDQLAISEFSSFVNKYVPTSVYGIIQRSTSGIVTTLLAWLYIGVMIVFVYYLIKHIFKLK